MKYYTLYVVANGRDVSIKKRFKNRYDAVEYAMNNFFTNGNGIEHRIKRTKHYIEYVCDSYNRFFVDRVLVK